MSSHADDYHWRNYWHETAENLKLEVETLQQEIVRLKTILNKRMGNECQTNTTDLHYLQYTKM